MAGGLPRWRKQFERFGKADRPYAVGMHTSTTLATDLTADGTRPEWAKQVC